MADPLRPVPVRDLRLLGEGGRHWRVDQPLEDLDSLTPVRGWIHAVHRGTLLEVEGEAEAIVSLRCDRCLQWFNHTLGCRPRELIWLEADSCGEDPSELQLRGDDLTERLDPRGCFDPARWIFDHLHLQQPLVRRCGAHCPGPDLPSGRNGQQSVPAGGQEGPIDPRWEILRQLHRP